MASARPAKKTGTKKSGGFSAEEKAALRERAKELKAAGDKAAQAKAVREKIGSMKGNDKVMAEKVHALVLAAAPELTPRLWYGMPAYAKGDKTICFFQSGATFKTRYCTLGFSDKAALDDGQMWPTSYALAGLGPAEEAKISALVKQALR
jgi:uncharacterized protein YdhG (YjbR/CyaY superfamily)